MDRLCGDSVWRDWNLATLAFFRFRRRLTQRPECLLQDFPSTRGSISIEYLFDLFTPLQPRAFSISSCPITHPGQVQLTVAVVEYKTRMHEPRRGVCTSWLASLPSGITHGILLLRGAGIGIRFLPESMLACTYRSCACTHAGGVVVDALYSRRCAYARKHSPSYTHPRAHRTLTQTALQNPHTADSRAHPVHQLCTHGRRPSWQRCQCGSRRAPLPFLPWTRR